MAKSKLRNQNTNPFNQTQSPPPASSSPSSRVTKSGQHNNNKNKNHSSNNHSNNHGSNSNNYNYSNYSKTKNNNGRNSSNNNNQRGNGKNNRNNSNSNKTNKPQPLEVLKKLGLNSESPQAGPSNRPLTNDQRTKPSFKTPQVKVQEQAKSKPPLQRAHTPRVKKSYEHVSGFGFESKNKDPAQGQAPLQSQSSFQSLPPSPPTTVAPQRVRPGSEHHRNKTRESPNQGLGLETGRKPASPSRSYPSLPQNVVGLKNVTPDSDRDDGEITDDTSSLDEESESRRTHDPVSSRQSVVNLEEPTPVSGHDSQHKSRGASLSNSISQSQSFTISQSGPGSILPSPASSERTLGRKEATPASRPDYEQKTRRLLTSDIDTDSEPPSEAGPDSGPEPSSPSFSPCPSRFKWKMRRALKRKRSNTHSSSRRKAVPLPARPSLVTLREIDTEPILPTEPTWSTLSPLHRPTCAEPARQNFRSLHRRGACDSKQPPSPSSSQLDSMIGPESPSKSIAPSEFLPQESESESRDPSPTPSMTPASSPPAPLSIPRVVVRDITPSPPPQCWIPRLQWKNQKNQKSSLKPTAWTSRLRPKSYIRGGGTPLMIDGNKHPHLFAEFPPEAHNNPEWRFPDATDDDREFESADEDSHIESTDDDSDIELPTTKRPRLGLSTNLTGQEESPERGESSEPGSSDPGQFSESGHEPELLQSSASEQLLDAEKLWVPEQTLEPEHEPKRLQSSEREQLPEHEQSAEPDPLPDPLPELGRSSDFDSEQPRTPTSIRDELPIRRLRRLDKQIDEAVVIDKEENPTFWGGSWMKEYTRGRLIKERVEMEYREKIMREKEEDEQRKEMQKQERDKKKKERERKRIEEQRIQEEREAQKRKEEEQERRKQKEIQMREALERRREQKREKTREMLQKSLSDDQKRLMEDLGVEI
ncbi:hypothetical protein N7517_001121 [Penicillium concentricum]|uniref:Uncharacterized protein n=1 Tax=Penicillium concentricum TaxID=293559 RepID=A0A9W9SRH1_9EURO|nr:uncharacterized protein N7517_001121 [Penicillium concentricum]KAJ5383210.1 hypothetical protein N7517_001121 [Penicillium concentricum]